MRFINAITSLVFGISVCMIAACVGLIFGLIGLSILGGMVTLLVGYAGLSFANAGAIALFVFVIGMTLWMWDF